MKKNIKSRKIKYMKFTWIKWIQKKGEMKL